MIIEKYYLMSIKSHSNYIINLKNFYIIFLMR